jgi:hypothetical protein
MCGYRHCVRQPAYSQLFDDVTRCAVNRWDIGLLKYIAVFRCHSQAKVQ